MAARDRLAELGYSERSMGGSAIDPLPEQKYALIRAAVIGRQPIAAVYHSRRRLLCPHRLGWNGWNNEGRPQVLCYQYGGESESGLKRSGAPENELALPGSGETARDCVIGRRVADSAQPYGPADVYCPGRCGC